MKTLTLILLSLIATTGSAAIAPQYTPADSIQVINLLQRADTLKAGDNPVIFFARALRGTPYVAKTLEQNKREQLVINLRQLDCTTYVENVLALVRCHQNHKKTFADFCRYLQHIRYRAGKVAYTTRLHYFTEWIDENTRTGIVNETQSAAPPFTGMQRLKLSYMSKHPQFYPMLSGNEPVMKEILATEQKLSGRTIRYIPKAELRDSDLLRHTIHDGDIIAIVTRIPGLDTSHIGIAAWHRDGLHLLNASSVHHKVVEEPMTIRAYMQRHPSQIGIRVIKIRTENTHS